MRICQVLLQIGIVAAVHACSGVISVAQEESRSVGKDREATKSAEQPVTSAAPSIPTFKELATNLMTAREECELAIALVQLLEQRANSEKATAQELTEAKQKYNTAALLFQQRLETYSATMLEISKQMNSAQANLDAARKFYELCNVRNQEGTTGAKNAMDAQRQLDKAELAFANWETRQILYKKIGERLRDARNTYDPPVEFLGWGLRLVALLSNEHGDLGKTKYRGGMRILDVTPGSPAEFNGIQKGDILVGLDKWETLTADNVSWVLRQLDQADERKQVKVYLVSARETKVVQLPLLPVVRLRPKADDVPKD